MPSSRSGGATAPASALPGLASAWRHPLAAPVALAAALAGAYVVFAPATTDLAAQTFRAELFEQEGFVIWNAAWYAGHHVPGYSLFFPPLAALLSPELVGAIAAVAAAGLFAAITSHRYGTRARFGALWFAAAAPAMLLTGRLTFALGLAIGLAAMLALQRERFAAAVILAFMASLASPVAGLFTGLAAAAVLLARIHRGAEGWRVEATWVAPAAVALAAGMSLGLLALAFPTEGVEPFVLSAFVGVPLLVGAVLLFVPREERVLRIGVVLYGLLALAVLVVPTPLGGNATRLGALFAGPVLAIVLSGRRGWVLALVLIPALYWQLVAPVRDVVKADGDPSAEAVYYTPLIGELERRSDGPLRVHVPPTRNRWEAVHVAAEFPLARGWLRQLESDDFERFGAGGLTAESYERWLRAHDVRFVALNDADRDFLAKREASLIEDGLPFLQPVWSNPHWELFAFRPSVPSPREATVSVVGADRFQFSAAEAGSYIVRLRYTPYFQVVGGSGCVERAGDWTRVKLAEPPGATQPPLRVEAKLSLGGLLSRDSSCSEGLEITKGT
ncbi:MAG: hypothetical protein ACR2N5_03865 [Solirubrobacterales bacterium]